MACHFPLTVIRWATRVFDYEIQPVIVIKVFIDTWAKLKRQHTWRNLELTTVPFGLVAMTTVTIPTLVELTH